MTLVSEMASEEHNHAMIPSGYRITSMTLHKHLQCSMESSSGELYITISSRLG